MADFAMAPISVAATQTAHRVRNLWMSTECVVLLAYALMGKGAAYIGVPPVYIGEFLLVGGLVALLVSGRFAGIRLPAQLWCVAALAAWGLFRTAPYVSTYGFDAMRDAVIWGYGAFAFIWFFYLLSDPQRFTSLLGYYRIFAIIALIGMPAMWLVRFLMGDSTPVWPWADAAIIDLKAGDVLVHLAGIFAFWVSRPSTVVRSRELCVFGLVAGVMGAYERAGMLAFAVVFFLCAAVRPGHSAVRGLVTLAIIGLAALAITGIRLEVPTTETTKVREISFQQFAANVGSVIYPSNMGDLDDTKEWRLDWWSDIAGYTLRGPYFWTGKGFGINLADDDGFQVMDDHSLRSPHNGHLMILARAGVPGLSLWIIVQGTWGIAVGSALLRCLRTADQRWSGVFLFLFAYWLAFLINASFDVFLEGPMGGIWFWSLYGIGLAALWIWKQYPELLSMYENPYSA